MFISLFSTSNLLIKTIGLIPSIRILFSLRRFIRNISNGLYRGRNTDLNNFGSIFNKLNQVGVNLLINNIIPYYKDCIQYSNIFNNLFTFFLLLNSFGIFSISFKLTKLIFRITIGSLLSSIGILWSEAFHSYSYLRDIAYFIKNTFGSFLGINIPDSIYKAYDSLPSTKITLDSETSSSLLSVLGLIILGVGGVISILCITDFIYPESLSFIPYLGDFISQLNDGIYNIYSYFFGNSSNDGGSSSGNTGSILNETFKISPSSSSGSSGSSTSTINPGNFGLQTPEARSS